MAGSPQIATVRLPGARSMRRGEPSDCMPIDPARPGFAASRDTGATSVTTAVAISCNRLRHRALNASEKRNFRRHFLRLGAGTIGVALGSASLLSACGGDSISVAPVTTPRLSSASNFRDTAGPEGTGYVTTSGAKMKKACSIVHPRSRCRPRTSPPSAPSTSGRSATCARPPRSRRNRMCRWPAPPGKTSTCSGLPASIRSRPPAPPRRHSC